MPTEMSVRELYALTKEGTQLEKDQLEYVQLQLNYFDWDSPYVAAGRCYEVCKKHGKQVVVMEPVKGGCVFIFLIKPDVNL